jgi:hypothetical protein
MQLSQLTLSLIIRVILVEYKLCTHTCLLYSSVLSGYLQLLLSTQRRGELHQWTWRFLGVVSQLTSLWRPTFHVFILRFRIPWTDSWLSCNKDNSFIIYTLLFRDTCCDILMILLYICVTWSWRIYDCSIYVLINRVCQVWQNQPKLYRLKYASPFLRAPTCFKRYNPLASRVTSR